MGAITLPNFRITADVHMNTRLKDGGVAIDWTGLSNIKAWLYSDSQKALAGRVDVTIDQEDGTVLTCLYPASRAQYLGVNRLIVQASYMGSVKTYDKPVFNFVSRTADQAGEEIVIDDPEIDVEIEVTDTSSSVLDNAIAAAIKAADDAEKAAKQAEEAAELMPYQILNNCIDATGEARDAATAAHTAAGHAAPIIGQNGNWWIWDQNQRAYVDSGEKAQGPQGDTGVSIESVEQTQESQESEGENVVTVTLTDGTQAQFTVRNGKQGIQGIPGVANAKYKQVDALPTASADTMDYIYLVESSTPGVYNMSYTEEDGGSYTWKSLGTTAIQLSDYATKNEVSQLAQKMLPIAITQSTLPYKRKDAYIALSSATVGQVLTISVTAFSNFGYWDIPCREGDIFVITTTGNTSSAKSYAILDSTNKVLAVEQSAQTGTRLTIPANGERLIINSTINNSTYSVVSATSRLALSDEVMPILKKEGAELNKTNPDEVRQFQITSGNVWSSTSYDSGLFYQVYKGEQIRIKPNNTYYSIYALLKTINCAGDVTPDYMTGESARHQVYYEDTVTIPENGYIYIFNLSAVGNNYFPAEVRLFSFDKSRFDVQLSPEPHRNDLTGKKVVFIGASVVGGFYASEQSKRFSSLFCSKYGATELNLGVASTSIATNGKQSDASIAANTFATRATAVNLANAALIVVGDAGGNDFSYDSKAIGNLFAESTIAAHDNVGTKQLSKITDTDTYAGGLHNLIETIRTNAPVGCPIVVMNSSTIRGSWSPTNPSARQSNSNGDFLSDFDDATEKICEFYGIPFMRVSAFDQLDFTNAAISSAYSQDGLHPKDAGHARIAELLFRFVENYVVIS